MPLLFLLASGVGKTGSGFHHTFLLNNIKIKNSQKIATALEVEIEDILNCKF